MKGIVSTGLVFLLTLIVHVEAGEFQKNQKGDDAVKIGLLIADSTRHEARMAAALAVREANREASGVEFELIVRSMEGPWGTGSKEAVSLVFDEKVWAILGSHDGRNAHLVEQVIAKTHVFFVSAWSGDPTLSQAYVPWFFNCVPNNDQQAAVLAGEVFRQHRFSHITVLADKGYDAQLALKSFMDLAAKKYAKEPLLIEYDETKADYAEIVDRINADASDAVVVFGQAAATRGVLRAMHEKGLSQTVFGALQVLDEEPGHAFDLAEYEEMFLIDPGYLTGEKGRVFIRRFVEEYGRFPGPVAAYAYDGMKLIIETIQRSGYNRGALKETAKEISYSGITGPMEFNHLGNRIELPNMIKVKNGKPVRVDTGK